MLFDGALDYWAELLFAAGVGYLIIEIVLAVVRLAVDEPEILRYVAVEYDAAGGGVDELFTHFPVELLADTYAYRRVNSDDMVLVGHHGKLALISSEASQHLVAFLGRYPIE